MQDTGTKEPFKVLFADTFPYRHRQFMVRPGNSKREVHQKHVYTTGEFLLALGQTKWDVVFVPGYFDKEDDFKEIIREMIKTASKRYKPELVIYHGNEDPFYLCEQLSNVGITVAHIPWDFVFPNKHDRVKINRKLCVEAIQ